MSRRLPCAVIAALLSLVACRQEAAPDKPPIPVRVESARSAEAASGRHYSASLEPRVQVELDFQVEGTVATITQIEAADGKRLLQAGDRVTRDQPLAGIEDDAYVDKVEEAKAHLARANAEFSKAEATWRRDSNLYATKSITAPEYDRAKKEYESAVADVASAKASLDRAEFKLAACVIQSPLDGVVLSRSIEIGSYVRPGSEAFAVGDISSVKVAFGVPATARASMALGSTLQITTAATGAERFEGTITSVAPSADARTRVFEIEATVLNPQRVLLPGMVASLVTDAPANAGEAPLVVPIRSVLRAPDDPEGFAVAVVEGEGSEAVASLRTVTLGDVYGAEVIVTSGLDAGQRVIVTGATHVADGSAVRVVP